MTNEEAASYFGPMTLNPIPCGDLENLLNWGGEASRGSVSGAWEGLLIDFMLLNAVPELSEGLDELFTHLNQPRSLTVDTTEQPWAGKMEDLLNGLVSAGVVDASLIDDVIALGGGQPNIGTDYQAIRDAEVGRQNIIMWDAKVNEYIMPVLSDGTSTDIEIQAAIEFLCDAWGE
jgi:hypothetical protein